MAILTEKTRSFEFLIEPANGDRSFEEYTVDATGAELLAGAVLGGPVAGEYVAYNAAGADGSEDVAGVLCIGLEADGNAKRAVVARDATVKKYKLVYTGTEATVLAGLEALGIVAR